MDIGVLSGGAKAKAQDLMKFEANPYPGQHGRPEIGVRGARNRISIIKKILGGNEQFCVRRRNTPRKFGIHGGRPTEWKQVCRIVKLITGKTGLHADRPVRGDITELGRERILGHLRDSQARQCRLGRSAEDDTVRTGVTRGKL